MENSNSIIPPTVKIPQGFSNRPMVGKIEALYQENNRDLLTKFSPFTNNSSGLINFGPRQPYVYIFPNDGNKGINRIKKYDNRAFPIGSGLQDVERISKFMISGNGVLYIGKQFLLNRFNAFNETRIYNPLSPLAATARAVTLFTTNNPQRHIEGGLLGILSSLTGFKSNNVQRPQGVIGTMPVIGGNNWKGKVRAGTANSALDLFKQRHGGKAGLGVGKLLSQLGGPIGAAVGLFNSFKPQSQSGKERSDEIGYELMLNDPTLVKQAHTVKNTYSYKKKEDPKSGVETLQGTISGPSGDVFIENIGESNYKGETISSAYSKGENFKQIEDQLNRLLNSADKGIYTIDEMTMVDKTYHSLSKRRTAPLNQQTIPIEGYQKKLEGRNVYPLDSNIIGTGKGFSGTKKSDKVNSLNILKNVGGTLEDGEGNKYDPYADDQIAFYFHDLVNDKYIPFRSSVTGINDNFNANWTEISYVGRSNKFYNYTGFSRTLNFGFKVIANSITELLPMWKRINYLCGLTKPSRYTIGSNSTSKFPVPPVTTITIGDMYKDHPFIMESIALQIDDNALWETMPANSKEDWNYLNKRIVWKDSLKKFAQFPRECNISISGKILEKEIPQLGYNNFGTIGSAINKDSFFDNLTEVTSTEVNDEDRNRFASKFQ